MRPPRAVRTWLRGYDHAAGCAALGGSAAVDGITVEARGRSDRSRRDLSGVLGFPYVVPRGTPTRSADDAASFNIAHLLVDLCRHPVPWRHGGIRHRG